MNELAGLHPQISELSEYEQYLGFCAATAEISGVAN